MKLKKNLTALCSGCAVGALLLITAPTYADTTLGLWEFEQNSGAIIDSYTPRKNGHLGRWDGEYSSENVSSFKRDSGSELFRDAINFLGDRENQVVMIPDAVSPRFNPGMQSFKYEVRLKLRAWQLAADGKMENQQESWNVMQKGTWGQKGMWKMQIVPFSRSSSFFTSEQQDEISEYSDWAQLAGFNDPVLMCVIQNQNASGENARANTIYAMSMVRLNAEATYRASCEIDRTNNELRAIVKYGNGTTPIRPNSSATVHVTDISNQFGAINPGLDDTLECRAGEVAGFQGHNLSDMVSIGNKSYCPDTAADETDSAIVESDAFKGIVTEASIVRPDTW